MRGKILFFAALALYAPGLSALPNNLPTNCTISTTGSSIGTLTCTSGDLTNTGTTILNKADDNLVLVDLTSAGSPNANIINTGRLELSPLTASNAPGAIRIGGSIWNGTASGTSADAGANMKLSGGYVEIWGRGTSGTTAGVALLNIPTAGTALMNAADELIITGHVWNNTADGTSKLSGANGGIDFYGKDVLEISGDFISFAGAAKLAGDTTGSIYVDGTVNVAGGKTSVAAGNYFYAGTNAAGGIKVGAEGLLSITGGNQTQLGADGLTIAGGLIAGRAETDVANGNMEITNDVTALAGTGGYTISSYGDIKLVGTAFASLDNVVAAGTSLYLADGNTLNIQGLLSPIDVSLTGTIQNAGNISITGNIDSFESGNISSTGSINIKTSANDITVGSIANGAGGTMTLDSNTDLTAGSVSSAAGGGNLSLLAKGMMEINGAISNAGAGKMTFDSVGAMKAQSINNTGAGGTIDFENAASIAITGNVQNAAGNTVSFGKNGAGVGSLSITGSGNSFVNNGIFWADVNGATTISAATIDLGRDSEFYLKTDTFSLNGGTDYGALLSATIKSLHLEITDAASVIESAAGITNGTDMFLSAGGIISGTWTDADTDGIVDSVELVGGNVSNNGTAMTVNATGTPGTGNQGNIAIGGTLTNGAGTFNMRALGDIFVKGKATNGGAMIINGASITMEGAFENHGNANLTAGLAAANQLTIGGLTTNYGTLAINANKLSLGDFENHTGTATIKYTGGTDDIKSVKVLGGTVNLNIGGTTTVQNGIDVQSGAVMNILSGGGITIANNGLTVAGNTTVGGTTGAMNITGANFAINANAGPITMGGLSFAGTGKSLGLTTTGNICFGAVSGGVCNDAGAITVGGTDSNTLTLNANAVSAASLTQTGSNNIVVNAPGLTLSGAAAFANNGGIDMGKGEYVSIDLNSASNVFAFNAASLTGGGIAVGAGQELDITLSGAATLKNKVFNDGTLNITANGFSLAGALDNSGDLTIDNGTGNVSISGGDITNTGGTLTLKNPGRGLSFGAMDVQGGDVVVEGSTLGFNSINVAAGSSFVFDGSQMIRFYNSTGNITLANDLAFGIGAPAGSFSMQLYRIDGGSSLNAGNITTAGALVVYDRDSTLSATSGTIRANSFESYAGSALQVYANSFDITSAFTNHGDTDIEADYVDIGSAVTNTGTLDLTVRTSLSSGDITNSGDLSANVYSDAATATAGMITNAGTMSLAVWGQNANAFQIAGLDNTAGKLSLTGHGFSSSGDVLTNGIYHDPAAVIDLVGAVSIKDSTDYAISTASGKKIDVAGDIVGSADRRDLHTLTLNTQMLTVLNDIDAKNGKVVVSGKNFVSNCKLGLVNCAQADRPLSGTTYEINGNNWMPWLTVDVGGSVSGGTQFFGLGRMKIGGDYVFDDKSILSVAVLPNTETAVDSLGNNYNYAGLLDADPTGDKYSFFGKITGGGSTGEPVELQTEFYDDDGITLLYRTKPLIEVDDVFTTNITKPSGAVNDTGFSLSGGNIGLTIFDTVDAGTVVWLLSADKIEIVENSFLPRNLNVFFCDANGQHCFNYLTAAGVGSTNKNGNPTDSPAYVRQEDNNLFIVFDPAYGGPILLDETMLSPAVARLNPSPNIKEGAEQIDNWIRYGMFKYNPNATRLPIEALKAYYSDTIYKDMASALYDRMESYKDTQDPKPYQEFVRLFLPTEAAEFAHLVNSNEKMTQGALQKRMIDEALWTRNRVKNKIWIDADYRLMSLANPDGNKMTGNAQSVAAGFDTQVNPNNIIGFNAGMTLSGMTDDQGLDLSFGGNAIAGERSAKASDMMMNIGAYIISKFSDSSRLYASANMYSHKLGLDRTQSYMGKIGGDTTMTSFGGEVGLIHSISGQYLIGNLSARFASSGGWSITESVDGKDYMMMQQEKYNTFSPGYSLLFQKRIYLQPTFIMRPYASVGAEYEVIGMGDTIRYRFASSDVYSDYKIETDPLWANARVGLEFLTIGGLQFGAGYGFHYNAALQMHDFSLSASMRF